MIVLYASDLFLIESKYNQLSLLVDHFKPNYVVLNGSLFTPHPYYKGESTSIENIGEILQYLARYTKVICQLGNFDIPQFNEFLNTLCQKSENIVNLTDKHFFYDVITFLGVSGVVTNRYNSDWLLPDNLDIKSIESQLDVLTIQCDLQKTIIVTSVPPIGSELDTSSDPLNHGSYTLRNFLYKEPISPRLLLTSGFPDNFKYTSKYYTTINECVCVNPSQPLDDFYYCIINIDDNLNVIDIWHPKKFYSIEG